MSRPWIRVSLAFVGGLVALALLVAWQGSLARYDGRRAGAPAWTAPCWTANGMDEVEAFAFGD